MTQRLSTCAGAMAAQSKKLRGRKLDAGPAEAARRAAERQRWMESQGYGCGGRGTGSSG